MSERMRSEFQFYKNRARIQKLGRIRSEFQRLKE